MDGEDTSKTPTFFVDREGETKKNGRSSSNKASAPGQSNGTGANVTPFFFDWKGDKSTTLTGSTQVKPKGAKKKKNAKSATNKAVAGNKKAANERKKTQVKQENGRKQTQVKQEKMCKQTHVKEEMDIAAPADADEESACEKSDVSEPSVLGEGERLEDDPLFANDSELKAEDEAVADSANEDWLEHPGSDSEPEDDEDCSPKDGDGSANLVALGPRRKFKKNELKRILKWVSCEYWDWLPVPLPDKRAWKKEINNEDKALWRCKLCNITRKGGQAIDIHLSSRLHGKNETAQILSTTLAPRRSDAARSRALATPPPIPVKSKNTNKNRNKQGKRKRKADEIANGDSNVNEQQSRKRPAHAPLPLDSENQPVSNNDHPNDH